LGFEENLAASQSVLSEWFTSQEVTTQLDSTGVYWDANRSRTAIEFERAAEVHEIQGLP
jgi:propanediol dehydratase small subunit